jgi:molecular chaperone HscC
MRRRRSKVVEYESFAASTEVGRRKLHGKLVRMIVGIDLGTTNSAIGVFRDGGSVLIPNAHGDLLTPSAVGLDEQGHVLVGLPARERAGSAPTQTAQAFKRWMGTDKRITLGRREFRAEELSALVLQSLKGDAEAFLGEPVSEAVITVPAYFNEAQRRATRAAGELAGFKVERLLNEPTAAGLSYGLQERPEQTSFLVFDLGGGTFDVSILEYFEGVVEVRASAGDTRLGGEDFVDAIGALLARKAGFADDDTRAAWLQRRHWWRAAEQAKRDLGSEETVHVDVEVDGKPRPLALTRAEFEEASAELLQRLRRPIERTLRDARIDMLGLDEVVLVGGASRMPMIRQLVTRLFQRLPLRTIDPDLAIAQGAAVQAGLKARDAALREVVLTDVMPYSLGIVATERLGERLVRDRFTPIIERNTPVPVSRVQSFFTITDQQRVIVADVRQGESPVGSENLALGTVSIDVPPRPAGQVQVDVRFTYDANGLLDVDLTERETGVVRNLLIKSAGSQMSETDVQAALAKLAALKRHPREEEENRYLVERAKRLYADRLGEQREMLQHWLMQFEAVLDRQDAHAIRHARKQFREAMDSIDDGFRF